MVGLYSSPNLRDAASLCLVLSPTCLDSTSMLTTAFLCRLPSLDGGHVPESVCKGPGHSMLLRAFFAVVVLCFFLGGGVPFLRVTVKPKGH